MAIESKEHVASALLHRAHSPHAADTIFTEKIKQRPLILRPTSPDPSLNARSRRQHARHQRQKAQRKSRAPKPLSAKQKRALSLYEIPPAQQKYAIYEPLHELWCKYMRDIFSLAPDNERQKSHIEPNDAGPFLASADYHGAAITVVRSKCRSRVGISGLVVKDTKFVFEIVTNGDSVKVVPKEGTVFRFEVPFEEAEKKPLAFEVLGSMFQVRAPERANKKFRMHMDPDL